MLPKGGALGLVDPRKDHLFGWAAIDLVERGRMLSECGFAHSKVDVGPWWSPVERAEVFIQATA